MTRRQAEPRGRPPLYRRWDESVGARVLDEGGEALQRRQLELPPPRRDGFATQELFDAAREPWYVLLMGTRLPP